LATRNKQRYEWQDRLLPVNGGVMQMRTYTSLVRRAIFQKNVADQSCSALHVADHFSFFEK
jgi:hypothetical protein